MCKESKPCSWWGRACRRPRWFQLSSHVTSDPQSTNSQKQACRSCLKEFKPQSLPSTLKQNSSNLKLRTPFGGWCTHAQNPFGAGALSRLVEAKKCQVRGGLGHRLLKGQAAKVLRFVLNHLPFLWFQERQGNPLWGYPVFDHHSHCLLETCKALAVDSWSILLNQCSFQKTVPFSLGFWRFSRKIRIAGKNGEGTPRPLIHFVFWAVQR